VLSRAAIVLSAAGILVAAYLTWVHFDTNALVCGLGDCRTVQASEYATIGPIPVALLGLGMYATILGSLLAARRQPAWAFGATAIALGMALAGLVYAAYLTWIEVAVIDAICQWCVVSAVLTAALTMVLGAMLWRAFSVPFDVESETGSSHAAS
jgi:uncharacterized membrane protein